MPIDGNSTSRLKEVNESKSLPSYEETVTNKALKTSFSKLASMKLQVLTFYTIFEVERGKIKRRLRWYDS